MLPVLIVIVLLFALVFLGRVGAASRAMLTARWPAVVLAAAATFALARGAIWPAAGLAGLAFLAWRFWPGVLRGFEAPRDPSAGPAPADAEARAILGVGPAATAEEIRRAYRTKMSRAHPDRGGDHVDAARLTAARDRLLKGR